METSHNAERPPPVDAGYDVLVIGGGPAGAVTAFITGSRQVSKAPTPEG